MTPPRGDLALRTLAMPADTNPNGDIFGGWLLSQMDMAGGKRLLRFKCDYDRAIKSMSFHHPVAVGEAVCCHTEIVKEDRTSMRIRVEVSSKSLPYGKGRIKITEEILTYVAIDNPRQEMTTQGRNRFIYSTFHVLFNFLHVFF